MDRNGSQKLLHKECPMVANCFETIIFVRGFNNLGKHFRKQFTINLLLIAISGRTKLFRM